MNETDLTKSQKMVARQVIEKGLQSYEQIRKDKVALDRLDKNTLF